MSASARLTSWFVSRSSRSASWRQLGGLDLPRLAVSSIAGQVQHARGDCDEAGIVLANVAEQRNLVLCDKRHAVEVVAELVDLAKRAGQRRIVRRREGG